MVRINNENLNFCQYKELAPGNAFFFLDCLNRLAFTTENGYIFLDSGDCYLDENFERPELEAYVLPVDIEINIL